MFDMMHDDTVKFMVASEVQTHDVLWDAEFDRDYALVVRLLRQNPWPANSVEYN